MPLPAYPLRNSNQVAVLIVAAVCTIMSTVAIGCRVWARHLLRRPLDVSDWLIIVAWVLAIGFQAICFLAVAEFGAGLPNQEVIQISNARGYPRIGFNILILPQQILWALSLSACKVSVLILYKRLFPGKKLAAAVWVTLGLIAAFVLTTILGTLFGCHPMQFFFYYSGQLTADMCDGLSTVNKVTGALNLVTDVLAITIAVPPLFALQLPLYKKLVLVGNFSVGFVACIVSLLRLLSLTDVDYADLTGTYWRALIYSAVEPSLAVVLGCVPLLRPLLRGKHSLATTSNTPGYSSQWGGGGVSAATAQATWRSRMSRPAPRPEDQDLESLTDDGDGSSQYQLRPVGAAMLKEGEGDDGGKGADGGQDGPRRAHVTVGRRLYDSVHERGLVPGAIAVRKEWEVKEEVQVMPV